MDFLNTAFGVVLGIAATSVYTWLRNRFVVRAKPLVAMRSSGKSWVIRNQSRTRVTLDGAQFVDGSEYKNAGAYVRSAFLQQGQEAAIGEVPDGVLVSVYWHEYPMFSPKVKYRTGSFFTKVDEAEAVVNPRQMSPHGGK